MNWRRVGWHTEGRLYISLLHHDCSTGPMSLQEYGEAAHEGRFGAMSMPNQVIGRCCGYHKPLASQISSQICLGTPDKADFFSPQPQVNTLLVEVMSNYWQRNYMK